MTCLLGFEQGVDVFFFGVKGVGDVLAGLCLAFTSSSLVSSASMTCLLDVVELFVLVKGVGDVLAGRLSRVLTSSSLSQGRR